MDMQIWNPWHGCHKYSAGCKHCYVFREDAAFGVARASDEVRLTQQFHLPIKRDRHKNWKYPAGTEFGLCFTSDLFIKEADGWRGGIWDIIRMRQDCTFVFFTKRIERMAECLPDDWVENFNHVAVGCTVENQDRADFRLPIFLDLPIAHRLIIVAPMLEKIDLRKHLLPHMVESVSVGGESGKYARPLHYDWVLDMHAQCKEAGVPFTFHQTGSFLVKDGRRYHIPREHQHSQAKKAGLDS